ncbi:EscU/YscU/HrcU family type III secretion system export apparatus switch protein [Celeribacter indicus]|uniref:Flagellar biosynthesis protein FlhB n=1 Tax=Celeribacter indicus TaxID=1208324 RepID=A0A0B5DMF1_9RHOB|nr:flagellar type III secretion system protein FlhB [Celeribacter indicus]AJE44818.1 flagellar biosynthesis protein FlhB [Celeribacter indicus]SDX24326.1 flagellar biosynthetic protein FlhB [Celeribacter indicus]
MAEEGGEDKQYEPSQKRLDEARKKGEVPRAADLTTAASYFGFVLAAMATGAADLLDLGEALRSLLDAADRHAELWFTGSGGPWTLGLMWEIGAAVIAFFLIPAMLALVTIFATRTLVFAPGKLAPKLSKISPVANAANKFGRAGLFEFAKSFFKLLLYSVVLGIYLFAKLPEILATASLSPGVAVTVLLKLCVGFLLIVLMISAPVGAIDYLFQRAEHLRRHRMSRNELTDEAKEQEGDPHFKQKRRQKGVDIVMNQMLSEVPKADVVIVNPVHYAVALKWDRMRGGAPVCVAKGIDEIAVRIREVAAETGVPLHRDPPTARALYATVEIGEQILPDHYRAVAAAIRFAEEMRRKMRDRIGTR